MTLIVTPPNELQVELDMEVIVSEEDAVVYIKLSGFDTVQEAKTWLHAQKLKGYTLLIKGSRGIQMEHLINP